MSFLKKLNKIQIFQLVTLIILILFLTRVFYFFNLPDSELITIIPDDAFYYIQIAKNFSLNGQWSLDGLTKTSGFHLLHALFLFTIFEIFPSISWRTLFLIIGIISSLLIAISTFILLVTTDKIFNEKVALLSTIPFIGFYGSALSSIMMESFLIIFFNSITIYLLINKINYKHFFFLFIIGIFGALSRIEYCILPATVFIFSILLYLINYKRYLINSFCIMSGAIVGFTLSTLKNYLISGQLIQGSAKIKLFWSSLETFSIKPTLNILAKIFLPFLSRNTSDFFLFFFGITIFSIFIYFLPKKIIFIKVIKRKIEYFIIYLSLICAVMLYILFYSLNSMALQIWYASIFISLIGVIISGTVFFFFNKITYKIVFTVFIFYYLVGISNLKTEPYKHQAGMLSAALNIKKNQDIQIIGSWNAGILSYFSNKKVVNLDGLANDSVYNFIINNNLFDYIKKERINYIADYDFMFKDNNKKRGGYLDKRFDQCINKIVQIDDNLKKWQNSNLYLYKLNINCK